MILFTRIFFRVMRIKLLEYDSLYKILWNQYLIEDSTLYRVMKIKYLYKSDYYLHLFILILKFIGKDLIAFASISSFLIGYFFNKKIPIIKKDIFLLTRLSELNKISNKFQIFKVNLFPFIKVNEISSHIYSLLNLKEIFVIVIFSVIKFPKICFKILKNCKRDKISVFKYFLLNKLTFSTILELNLLYVCLAKIDKKSTISNSQQFTPYMYLLSVYKESKKDNAWSLHLYQHGVYELDKFKRPYNKVYVDKMFYKFEQSLDWIKESYISNKNCTFTFNKTREIFKTYLKKNPNSKIIAYASSGFYKQDNLILDKLNSIQKEYKNIEVLIFPHPTLNLIHIKKLLKKYSRLQLIISERFNNIDLLITGYSSLGLDYLNLNIKVLFIPFDDSICAFNDNSLHILKDQKCLLDKLKEILNI